MSEIYILWHLGMGDAILCNGLVRFYADRFDKVSVPAYDHNYDSVKFMFRDLESIKVIPVKDDREAIQTSYDFKEVLRLGYYSEHGFNHEKFDEEFYRQAKVPFECRWDKYRIDLINHKPFQEIEFVHDDRRMGFVIDTVSDSRRVGPLWMNPIQYEVMFNNSHLIDAAINIHCINSSFLCWIDSLPDNPKQKLFLHHYARPTPYPKLKRNWEIIK